MGCGIKKIMSNENTNNTSHLNIRLDAGAVLHNLLIELQHLLDIYKLSNSLIANSSSSYHKTNGIFLDVSPASNYKLDYSTAKAMLNEWNIRNVFRDSVEYISVFLEDVYTYCRAMSIKNKKKLSAKDWNNIWEKEKPFFHKLGLPHKLEYLKREYGIYSSLSDYLLSINKARNCLVRRRGIVSEKDIDGEHLIIKWHTLLIKSRSPDGKVQEIISQGDITRADWNTSVWLDRKEKKFKKDDKLKFSEIELSDTIMTLMYFGINLHQAMLFYKS